MHSDRPSATATFIARSLMWWAREPWPDRLVDAHALALSAACLHAAGIDGRRWWRLAGIAWLRRVIRQCERWILPGIVLHYVLRKRGITQAVERALAEGCTSLVVLAAGFDALAWRISRRHPAVRVLEVDHPATQAVKRRAMMGTRGAPGFHAMDLASTSPVRVPERDRPTVVVAEGLLMYFPGERVTALLRELSASLAPGSRVVFTFMAREGDGHLGFPAGHPLIDHWLRWHGEVFRWGVARNELGGFLARVGLRLLVHHDAEALAQHHLGPGCRRRGACGEDLVVAEPLPRA
jgi:methyltransferase (TIGR00027 family)